MAKRRYITSSMIERMEKQGRGLGRLNEYKPWLTVRDISSRGFVHRIKGWKTNRVHHLFSNLELSFFYTLEWATNVKDIRERYPLLPIYETENIGKRFSISHPLDRSRNESIVMTSDFLVDIVSDEDTKLIAYSVMPSKLRNTNRSLQKSFIERTYWKEHGINFIVVTEKDFDEVLIRNVEWVHDAKDIRYSPGLSVDQLYELEPLLFEKLLNVQTSLAKVCIGLDSYYGFKNGVSLWAVRHLIANRLWLVDMTKKLFANQNVEIVRSRNLKHIKELDSFGTGS